MTTAYPGALDAFNNPSSTDSLDTAGVLHDVQHADANDAIEAIEAELGINPSGSYSTVKDRLDASTPVLLINNGASVPAGTPAGTIIIEKGLASVTYDFTAGALPSGWSKHGTPSETFSGAGMATTFSATQGYHIGGLSTTNNARIELHLAAQASFGVMFGIQLTDNSGNGVGVSWYNGPAGSLVESVAGYNYNSSFNTSTGTPAMPSRLRLRQSGTNYYASHSTDGGATWSVESSALVSATTMTRLNVGSILGSSTATVERVIYTPAPLSGGSIKGWWDGTTLQPVV